MIKKKRFEIPHTYVIIFALIVISAISTFLIPGGEYNKETMEFSYVDSSPQTWQVLTSFYSGFKRQAGIIVFIFIVGASFWVVNSCRAIDAGIISFLRFTKKLERYKFLNFFGINNVIIIMVFMMFSLFGAIFGMSEETIAFSIIVIPLAISMGYDSIVGIAMVYVGAHVGFAGAFLNPFTIGIAQDIAGLPLFSGIEYRFVCWIVLNIISLSAVLLYASKIKKNPQKSVVYTEDLYWRDKLDLSKDEVIEYKSGKSVWISFFISSIIILLFAFHYPLTSISIGGIQYNLPYLLPIIFIIYCLTSYFAIVKSFHFYVLNLLLFTIIFLVVGVMGYGWYIGEISALFLAMAILSGIAASYSANEIVQKLLEGAKDIISAALVVGLAAGIIIILEEGRIVDTILFKMASAMESTGRAGSLGAMYLIQTVINIVIPSASAKAAITMPIMAPFSDLIGVSRQATVLAFQFGDGFTNMITPTSGVLIAVLSIAKVPYVKWFKLALPFIVLLIIIGFLLLLPTLFMPTF